MVVYSYDPLIAKIILTIACAIAISAALVVIIYAAK